MKKILLIIALTLCIFQMVVLATAIDVGSPAVNRSAYYLPGYTFISKNNPANESGTITSVEIYVAQGLSNCEIAIFEEVSTDHYTTRSNVTIGAAAAGYHQYDVSLAVEAGDRIGIYYSGGRLDKIASGGVGHMYKSGDHIPCTDASFSLESSVTITSLYGTGITEEEEDNVIFFGTNF